MDIKEFLREIASTGPGNIKKLLEMADKLPSDSTLQSLITTLNSLIPYIPLLESTLGNDNVKNLEKLIRKLPEERTLARLADALPMLEKMPDQATLNKLLEKADSLKGFLDSLEGV